MSEPVSKKENWVNFGKWLTAQRVLLGKSQAKMALAANMNHSQWNRIESGKSGTKRSTLIHISTALGVSIEEVCQRAGLESTFEPEANAQARDTLATSLATLNDDDRAFIHHLAQCLQNNPDIRKAQLLPSLTASEELFILNRDTGQVYSLDRKPIEADALMELVTLIASRADADEDTADFAAAVPTSIPRALIESGLYYSQMNTDDPGIAQHQQSE